ncbi:polyprenol monophosphomannose synthase [Hymenobacter sp. HSC-4F20]|uniref:polyprenol monophosphomannose synthase n=1 Tax=Hymenobacter sp. HSC-4F20 TaxID=2864135 RepID=UPI001C733DFC|nr:polyprenol monophosphomannose synthase [Hymenobacter sp. HSC-4F20]MBX0288803.1 polyprenol monophosphomannose synthase [Hymenobacter sp. HSC-4F20]
MNDGLVLIPTYNERENAELIIRKVFSLPQPFDVLVIDDGSPDGTAEIVRSLLPEFEGRLFLEERKGKLGLGTAYIHGFRWALSHGYQYVFEMDADFSHNPDDLIRLYDACAHQGYDLAIGSRYIQGVNVVNWPMDRVLMSYFASAYVRLITRMPIMDATAGFKCYTARVLRTIPLEQIKFVGYAFQIEMKWLAYKYGFRIKEVPIIFTDRTRGASKMSKGIFKEALFGVVQMKLSSWFRRFERVAPGAPVSDDSTLAVVPATSASETR